MSGEILLEWSSASDPRSFTVASRDRCSRPAAGIYRPFVQPLDDDARAVQLYAAIHEHGGIGPHRDGTLRTEYRQLARSLRHADGPPPDDLAHSLGQEHPEFGIFDEHDLLSILS